MSNPNRPRSGTQIRTRTRVQGASIAQRPTTTSRPASVQKAAPQAASNMPISTYRLVAAAALLMLLVLALLGPKTYTSPDTSFFLTPGIDGTNALPVRVGGASVEEGLFRYRSVIERNQGGAQTPPDNVADAIHYGPDDVRARRAIIGQMYASTSGNLNQTLIDTGFFSNLSEQKIEDIETAYRSFLGDEKRGNRGLNGLGVMALVRSLNASGQERDIMERTAIAAFQQAIDAEPRTWQFTYNQSLAHMLVGNYATAYDGMRGISGLADADNNKLTPFWMGLATLRLGDPGEAKVRFQQALDARATGGNEAFQNLYVQARDLSREGMAAAEWANGQTVDAYKLFYSILSTGNTDDTSLYTQWLRLGLSQRAYEQLAADLRGLEGSSGFGNSARVHHDRARLLTFLGRNTEADSEYKEALQLGQNDPSLLISYGQFLEARGDHNEAVNRAYDAIKGLGKDPAGADLTSVSHAVVLTTTSTLDRYAAQQLLDANLLRAHAWASSGQAGLAGTLVDNIEASAGKAPANEAGLIHLYAGMAAQQAGLTDKAVASYTSAWEKLKGQTPGSPGRGAALTGLARSTASQKDAGAGVSLLASNGYDVASPKSSVVTDLDAPDALFQGALLLDAAGKHPEAANAMRVSAITRNIQDVRALNGAGRPLWQGNGTVVPANAVLASAESAQAQRTDIGIVSMRYRQAASLDPALAPAWNNLGVAYAGAGNTDRAAFYTAASGQVSPDYALGRQNQATLEYKRGIGNFFNAEQAMSGAIRAAGPSSLLSGYELRADTRGPLPAPSQAGPDFLSRLPALIILILLALHTLVGNDRLTNRMGLLPTKGVPGMASGYVDNYVKGTFPRLLNPVSGAGALLPVLLVPSLIGMLALAWAAGHGSLGVALVFLPVAFLVSLLAFAANEFAQSWAARGHGRTLHHLWPLGLLLGIVAIPFGFLYGWQVVTRVQPGVGDSATKRARTGEERDMAFEAQAEAMAELDSADAMSRAGVPVSNVAPSTNILNLSPTARILAAGLFANLLLMVLFGIAYWLTAWPSLRLGMFASALVLAFTSVSEPPADGWTLYRRNGPLWLAIFIFAATFAVMLAVGLI